MGRLWTRRAVRRTVGCGKVGGSCGFPCFWEVHGRNPASHNQSIYLSMPEHAARVWVGISAFWVGPIMKNLEKDILYILYIDAVLGSAAFCTGKCGKPPNFVLGSAEFCTGKCGGKVLDSAELSTVFDASERVQKGAFVCAFFKRGRLLDQQNVHMGSGIGSRDSCLLYWKVRMGSCKAVISFFFKKGLKWKYSIFQLYVSVIMHNCIASMAC